MKNKLIFILPSILIALAIILWRFPIEDNTSPQVKYYLKTKISKVKAITDEKSQDLPEKLVIPPGNYRFEGKAYPLKKEGLYRLTLGDKLENRIVYERDTIAFLSALAWIETPKLKDKYSDPAGPPLEVKALTNNIGLSCGNITAFAARVLAEQNIKSRAVMALNLHKDNEKLNTDSGHTLLEVDINGRWLAFDIDNNVGFDYKTKPLSYWELFWHVKNKERYGLVPIAADYDNQTEKELREYYQDVFEVPFVADKNKFYFTAEGAEKEGTHNYSKKYVYMERSAWLEQFYPGYGYK